jgi:hypothetical protein
MELLDAALYYASIGWHIFPLAPGQKTPITSHGCKDATTDESQIRLWWSKWPNANIGLACGSDSGVYVLDIDVKNGCSGFNSLNEFPSIPATVRQETPSGGAHLLFSSTVAPANRNSYRPGIDIRCNGYYIVIPPSTHPNGKRYCWKEDCAPWEIKLAEFPEFMRPATRSPWNNVARQDALAVPIATSFGNVNSSDRASLYLSRCDPAIQGQCGHNKLLYVAGRMIHGFLLSESQTFEILEREYNPRCIPPWDLSVPKDLKDFNRKISEAVKLPPQHTPGWLLEEGHSVKPVSEIDVQSILGSCVNSVGAGSSQKDDNNSDCGSKQESSILSRNLSQDQEYDFLVRPIGLLGQICSWINDTAIKEQPLLTLGASLAFLGALFGRKVKDEMGSRTNLYCIGVAPSSAGKNHALKQLRLLANESGCTHLLGGDSIASDSAIEDRVYREPSTLFLWDEVGLLLSHIKSGISQHYAQVVSLLMKLYSSASNVYLGKEYADQKQQRIIIQPCCCIYGTSTLVRFADGISPMELQDGWLSRCLIFYSPVDMPKQRGRKESGVPATISDIINSYILKKIIQPENLQLSQFVTKNLQQQPPVQLLVETDPDAEKLFIEFDNESITTGKKVPLLECIWAKAEENARRIALIVACGDNLDNPRINKSIADYSCRLVRYLLTEFGTNIAPEIVMGETSANKRKIHNFIHKGGVDGRLSSEITKATQWLTKRARMDMVDDMVDAGELAYHPEKNGKAWVSRYWTAENYAKKVGIE